MSIEEMMILQIDCFGQRQRVSEVVEEVEVEGCRQMCFQVPRTLALELGQYCVGAGVAAAVEVSWH